MLPVEEYIACNFVYGSFQDEKKGNLGHSNLGEAAILETLDVQIFKGRRTHHAP